jgi:hypothetical protein
MRFCAAGVTQYAPARRGGVHARPRIASTGCMRKTLLFAVAWLTTVASAAQLTEAETRWLQAGAPVLAYAKAHQLALDVVVQPQDTPGAAPLSMGWVDGRCKLVLSMRGNPRTQELLEGVDASLVPLVIELMVAHEVGHCWRHASGRWNELPAGFVHDEGHSAEWRAMRATRREEGFADLVGLAWMLRRHRAQYAAVQAWLEGVRRDPPLAGSHHDTRAWLRLAQHPGAFDAADTPFEQAERLWRYGLQAEDRPCPAAGDETRNAADEDCH